MTESAFLKIVDPRAPCTALPSKLACEFAFSLDPFQQHAVAAISRDENVLVTAKTGSGKTLVGEYQIAHSLAKGRRVFYTTPIKSLSNQKFHDLKKQFQSVGIMTGDLKFRPDAAIVIMTTEILRNLLFKRNSAATRHLGITAELSLENLDAVIFDECHYINDQDRGAVWEECMILLPREVNLVLLSATIQQPEFFAAWLGELKQKLVHLISTEYRIVPLQHGVYRGDELLTVMDNKERFEAGIYKAWLQWRAGLRDAADQHRARVADRRRGGYADDTIARVAAGPKAFKHQMNELVARLETGGLLPALFFVFSRKDCERYAAAVEHTLLDSSDIANVKHIVSFHLHRYGDDLQRLPQFQALRGLLEKGIAFHHSGLLPVLKEIVEILFGRGLIKLLFATETFAVGINMPTKTVVFTGYRKFDERTGSMRMLNTDEYIQMAGRAGRRGKDDRGLVLYLPDREPEATEDVRRMMAGSRATFQSRMTFHYDFLLKTLQAGGDMDWRSLMRQSYWYRRHEQMLEAERRELNLLEVEGAAAAGGVTAAEREALMRRDSLAEKLRQSTNAERRRAQQEWSAWENQHVGAKWAGLVKETWPRIQRLEKEIEKRKAELLQIADPAEDVWPSLVALGEMGLLEVPVRMDAPLQLTPLGTMATEINEGHQILMTLAYHRGYLKPLNAEEILAFLAAFLGDGKSQDIRLETLDGTTVPARVLGALQKVEELAAECERKEVAMGTMRPPRDSYWSLQFNWIEPIWKWLGTESAETDPTTALVQITSEYGAYEGNFIRMLLKLVNILEEFRSLATLATDVETLQLMRDMDMKILRGVAVCDSLYLRI